MKRIIKLSHVCVLCTEQEPRSLACCSSAEHEVEKQEEESVLTVTLIKAMDHLGVFFCQTVCQAWLKYIQMAKKSTVQTPRLSNSDFCLRHRDYQINLQFQNVLTDVGIFLPQQTADCAVSPHSNDSSAPARLKLVSMVFTSSSVRFSSGSYDFILNLKHWLALDNSFL